MKTPTFILVSARERRLLAGLLFCLAALATLIALVSAFTYWSGSRALTAHLADLRAQGEPVELAELAAKPIPDAGNFAMVPWLQGLALKDEILVPAPTLAKIQAWQRQLSEARSGAGPKRAVPEDPTAAGEIQLSLELIEPHLAELRTAARDLPGAQFRRFWERPTRADGNPVFNTGRVYELAQVLDYQANHAIAAGNRSLARDDLRVIHRLAESLVQTGTLLSSLIAQAMNGLLAEAMRTGRDAGIWSADDYADLQGWLSTIDLPAAFNRGLRAERIATTRYFRDSPEEIAPEFVGVSKDSLAGKLVTMLAYGSLLQAAVGKDEIFQIELAAGFDLKPPRLFPEKLQQVTALVRANRTSWNPAVRLAAQVSSNMGNIVAQFGEDYAKIQMTSVSCALERFRLENGLYPESLAALVPRYFEAAGMPVDLFSGKPYVYHQIAPEAYRLYSVGKDGKDDGGDADKDLVWPR